MVAGDEYNDFIHSLLLVLKHALEGQHVSRVTHDEESGYELNVDLDVSLCWQQGQDEDHGQSSEDEDQAVVKLGEGFDLETGEEFAELLLNLTVVWATIVHPGSVE